MPVDVCDIVADVIDAVLNRNDSNIICKLTIPADVRVIGNHAALLHDMIVRKEFLIIHIILSKDSRMVMQMVLDLKVNVKI